MHFVDEISSVCECWENVQITFNINSLFVFDNKFVAVNIYAVPKFAHILLSLPSPGLMTSHLNVLYHYVKILLSAIVKPS